MKNSKYKGTPYKGADQSNTMTPQVSPPCMPIKPMKKKTGTGMMYAKKGVGHQSENYQAPHNPRWI